MDTSLFMYSDNTSFQLPRRSVCLSQGLFLIKKVTVRPQWALEPKQESLLEKTLMDGFSGRDNEMALSATHTHLPRSPHHQPAGQAPSPGPAGHVLPVLLLPPRSLGARLAQPVPGSAVCALVSAERQHRVVESMGSPACGPGSVA